MVQVTGTSSLNFIDSLKFLVGFESIDSCGTVTSLLVSSRMISLNFDLPVLTFTLPFRFFYGSIEMTCITRISLVQSFTDFLLFCDGFEVTVLCPSSSFISKKEGCWCTDRLRFVLTALL